MPALLPTPTRAPASGLLAPQVDRRGANASTILRSILDSGPVARSTVARRTGLSAAAVTRLCQDLAARNLVRELPARAPQANLGRPHVPVDIDDRRYVAAGIHVAVPHATIGLTDLRGRVLAQEVLPHGDAGPVRILERAADTLAGFLGRRAEGRGLLGIGLATGGRVDTASGDIVWHNQLGWRDVPAGRVVGERLGMPVLAENHSRALARAELLFGAIRDRARHSLVHLFVGNMVDAALSTAGTVHHGPGSAAGEIAHLPLGESWVRCPCGRTGCLQATVSDRAMGERAAAAGVIGVPSFDALVAAARAGEPGAVELFRRRARLVGRAAAMLLDLVNPDVLVVAEGGLILIPELAPLLLADLHAEVAERSLVCADPRSTVLPSTFGSGLLAVAASSTVLDAVYARPLALSTT
jgi:predicted NBD/HSP70 family sugar kinase